MMKAFGSLILPAVVISASAMVVSCSSANKGTAIGGGTGAAVGAAAGGAAGGAEGAVAGGAVGGVAGAAIGTYLARQQEELQEVVPTTRTERGLKLNLQSDILFDFDSAKLRDQGKQTLNELAEIFKKYERDQLRIVGFTDHIGSDAYNQRLSAERARAVEQFLAEQGVELRRMESVGAGEAKDPATSPGGRQENRRVEIYVTVPQQQQQQQAGQQQGQQPQAE